MLFAKITAISTQSVALNMVDSHRIATCKWFFFLGQLHVNLAQSLGKIPHILCVLSVGEMLMF